MTISILSESTITQQAAGEANGASWGPWKQHAVRTADGTLYAAILFGDPVYGTGGDQNAPLWYTHLWRLFALAPGASAWQDTGHSGRAGREPGALALTATDELIILAWPHNDDADPLGLGAHPVIHRQSTGFAVEPVPGDWSVTPTSNEHWPYSQISVDDAGRLYIVQCIAAGVAPSPNTPGAIRVAIREPGGTWSQVTHHCDQRHTAPYLLPNASGYDLIGTRDCRFAELGLPTPQDGNPFDYVLNRISLWRVAQRGQDVLPVVLGEEPATASFPRPMLYGRDVIRDQAGTLHIVGEDNSAAGYSGRHTLVHPDGTVSTAAWPVPFQNLSRIVQDAGGRFYAVSLYQGVLHIALALDGDTDGTQLGPVQSIQLTGQYPAGLNYNVYVARGRALSNTLDLLWDIDNYRWFHVQLQLSEVAPVPDPTPTPTPTPTPAPQTDPLAAITAQITAITTAVGAISTALATLAAAQSADEQGTSVLSAQVATLQNELEQAKTAAAGIAALP